MIIYRGIECIVICVLHVLEWLREILFGLEIEETNVY